MKHFFKRSLAYILDCTICYSLIMLIVQWSILSNIRESIGLTDEWFRNSVNMGLYVAITISIPVWLYFTYFDSKKGNGTIGKRILKLLVINSENKKVGIGKSFQRTFLKLSPWEIAHMGVIFPTPLYYEDDPNIRILTFAGMFLFVIYVVSIMVNPNSRSVYDALIGTRVIEKE